MARSSSAMDETIPDSSGMGHATAEITRKAEREGMNTDITTKGRTDCSLVYNTVRTRVTPCVHAPRDQRELDQERRSARSREVDGDIVGVECMSISVTGREQMRTQEKASRWVTYRPKTPPLRPWLIAAWVSTAVYDLPAHTQGSEVGY